MTAAKSSRNVDQRILLLGSDVDRSDELFTIRLAAYSLSPPNFN